MENQDNIFLSELDVKQIKLIEENINLFIKNKIEMFDFICLLTGILNSFEHLEKKWKDKIQTEINTLEMVYDSIADNSILEWNDSPNIAIKDSIFLLKKITQDIMEYYFNKPNPLIFEVVILLNNTWYMCPLCTEAWESESCDAMILCPKCHHLLHNPRHKNS